MTTYVHPSRIVAGQLLWLELEEFGDSDRNRPMIPVRVVESQRSFRTKVELLSARRYVGAVTVDSYRLYEESSL